MRPPIPRAELLLGLVLGCASCATPRGEPGAIADIQPDQRPAIDSSEAGLWTLMEDAERRLARSGRVVRDPALNDYLRRVICRVSPEYCEDIRIYVVRTPQFNASMAPNGFMQVWTGLLLRAQNEAQLAYVLGHELGHYVRRHSAQQWRAVRNASDALILVDLAAGATGVRYVSEVAQLAALGTVLAFSRDQEREADEIGFEELVRAGYDVHEAPKIWEDIIAERDAADDPEAFIFFSTHPSSEERVQTLRRLADQAQADIKAQDKGRDEHVVAIRPFRAEWIRDELDRRDFAALEVVLENLREGGDQLGEIDYFQGELYRLRSEDGDVERAIDAYLRATSEPGAPVETHRQLGLLYWQSGQLRQAQESFRRYLEAAPGAPDREMIDSYLEEMGA